MLEAAQGRDPSCLLHSELGRREIEKPVFKPEPQSKHKHLFVILKAKQDLVLLHQRAGQMGWWGPYTSVKSPICSQVLWKPQKPCKLAYNPYVTPRDSYLRRCLGDSGRAVW